MIVYKITITSWTSSFRYPNLISGFQPTLEVPPISTILGLINSTSGYYNYFDKISIGYYFQFQSKGVDLETIYQIAGDKDKPTNEGKSNIIKREFLFDNMLCLYFKDKKFIESFKEPKFQLLLGRMNDLATIEKIEEVELEEIRNTSKIKGQIVPFKNNFLPGKIQVLPQYFTNTFPRRNLVCEPYSIINCKSKDSLTKITAYRDKIDNQYVDIYFHELNFFYENE